MITHQSEPDFSHIKPLLLDMAREQSTDSVLRLTVERLAQVRNIACALVWLLRPGDRCEKCDAAPACSQRTKCLHLVASQGDPERGDLDWGALDRRHHRVPLGVSDVGLVATTREGMALELNEKAVKQTDLDWEFEHGIRGFAGQPLLFQGELLGVIVVCTWGQIAVEGPSWLRIIADHAAAALANSRAFEEIQGLRNRLAKENDYLREEVQEANAFGDIIGKSAALNRVLEQIQLVAPTDASVVILGESGTGKELVARHIHRLSERAERPLIRINCAAVPRELYDSEFFGHTKGSFTGAVKDRVGRFELADGGTLFLDEIGELPLEVQSKLLRVLQEGQYERVGDTQTRDVDVRIITATHRDLKKEVEEGRFREDLFYRLNVFPIEVAPLRQRAEDIPLLAQHFIDEASRRLRRPSPLMSDATDRQLKSYGWPGNVRELQNVIERAVITNRGGEIDLGLPRTESAEQLKHPQPVDSFDPAIVLRDEEIRNFERANMLKALECCGWRVYGPQGAAKLLGMKPTTLSSRIERLGLRPAP